MATYAIGDLQGCYTELNDLLELINFDTAKDQLWFAGDIINRGPDSLACLRFVHSLGKSAITVLGNHDLHLLAIVAGHGKIQKKDTLDDILAAPDKEILLEWLIKQPLLIQDKISGFTLIHAGVHPHWDIDTTLSVAKELEVVLRGEDRDAFFATMYGDQPENWSESLKSWDRIRVITNCLTRLRYCYPDGRIDLKEKNSPENARQDLIPWFVHPNRRTVKEKIIFGHWSTVRLTEGQDFNKLNVFPIDGGCLWGGNLIALRLEDERYFSVPSRQVKNY